MQQHRAIRMGAAAILCAIVFRLCSSGLPETVVSWLTQPNILAFLTYLETGRNVRFSASQEVFVEYSPESPQPWLPAEPLPRFSDTALTEMYYSCSLRPDIQALLEKPLSWDLTGEQPTVLILHTHATESYTPAGESYVETSAYRTLDESYNMLSIGALVAELLAEEGITAVQDRALHDYPSYNGSYVDARKAIQEYLEKYPTIRLVLDLHRDAAGTNANQLRTEVEIEGKISAQLMLVMGTNAAGQKHPHWEDNLSLGLKLQAQLETQAPGITRPTVLRAQRFNQDLCPGALLVEVGAAGNTHAEARLAAEQLARAIATLAKGTE